MTDLLKQVISQVEMLPQQQQDTIAEAIQRELEELEWDTLIASPASQRFLDELAAEARPDRAAGLAQESIDRW